MLMVVFKMDVSNMFQKLTLFVEFVVTFVTFVLFDGFCKIVDE